MIKTPAEFAAVEVTIGHWIRFVGGGIEIFGVLVIVLGIIWSTYLFLHRRDTLGRTTRPTKSALADPYCLAWRFLSPPIS